MSMADDLYEGARAESLADTGVDLLEAQVANEDLRARIKALEARPTYDPSTQSVVTWHRYADRQPTDGQYCVVRLAHADGRHWLPRGDVVPSEARRGVTAEGLPWAMWPVHVGRTSGSLDAVPDDLWADPPTPPAVE